MKRVNLSGSRFGVLTVLSPGPNHRTSGGKSVSTWITRCDCGNEFLAKYGNLRTGKAKSCGKCDLLRAKSIREILGKGGGGPRQVWNQYRHRANKKRIPFKLTVQEVEIVTSGDCHYCGSVPQNTARRESVYSIYRYNGLDRVDCSRGYERGNVVACCKVCNFMKHRLSVEEFRSHVLTLARRCAGW